MYKVATRSPSKPPKSLGFTPRLGVRAVLAVGYIEFDSNRYLRMLCRSSFLQTVPGKTKQVYSRLETWPPSPDFFEGTPIGLTYYLQKWFRFHLQDWITRRMRELESKEGVYSLDGRHWFQNAHHLLNDLPIGNECILITDHSGSYKNNIGEDPPGLCLYDSTIGWILATCCAFRSRVAPGSVTFIKTQAEMVTRRID